MSPQSDTHHMWGGRFALGPSEALDALNRSLPVDHRLWPQDVAGSKAWVHALCRAGVLTTSEESQLLEGLDRVADKLADGAAVGAPDEDVHTLVERLLYAEIGAVAGKLHTGRSRNDQVATDLRLWTLGAIDELDAAVAELGRTLVAKAKDGLDAILPGYTHGQRAQPVRWAYVLLAHAWPLVRDRQRLADARRRTAEMPLGSGALAGSGFPVDRVLLKEALGFRAVSANALDATGDRDFVAEVLFAIALVGTHLSRLGAELITYASGEFGFVTLADNFSTGSSLMPQKRNPDVFELARGKAGRMLGDCVALLTVLKGIPAGYQKDLQEDKALLFDACDTLAMVLPAVTGAIDTLTVNVQQIGEIGGPHRRVERCGHPLDVHGERVDRSGDGGQHHRQRIARVEQQRLVFLQVFLIAGRNSFQHGEQRDAVAQHPSGLAARQLEHIRVAFLRHEAGAGAEVVGQGDESEFAARVGDELRAQTRQVGADQRDGE